jgi:hypothetical protein
LAPGFNPLSLFAGGEFDLVVFVVVIAVDDDITVELTAALEIF